MASGKQGGSWEGAVSGWCVSGEGKARRRGWEKTPEGSGGSASADLDRTLHPSNVSITLGWGAGGAWGQPAPLGPKPGPRWCSANLLEQVGW